MQLTVDNDGQATLRIQTRGQEPFELKLPYTLEKNVLTLGDGDQKMTMGEIASTTDDKIVFKRDNATITFSKI